MKVLLIGGGGREHALAWKIRQSPLVRRREDLLCVAGNAGIESEAVCLPAPAGGLSNVAALADMASKNRVDLTVVGPELPLTVGIADELAGRGLAVFGASRAAARLEGSKVFAKQFMARHGIPTASFEVFDSVQDARAWLGSAERTFPVVVKADGLAAGKGVIVASDRQEAERAALSMLELRALGAAGERIVIEECLAGVEASFFAITDGAGVAPLATCQDYKRAADGDRGPNTGGMGAHSPSAEIDGAMEREILDRIVRPAIRGMAAEGAPYRGVIYAGLMLTESGPMVLEFNARFGDPEAQVLMPRLASDLVPLMAWAAGMGAAGAPDAAVRWRPEWAACVVLASRGYPESSVSGHPIHGLREAARLPGTVVFHAGTRGGAGAPVTAGGRVLAVSALGRDLREAVERAYLAVERLGFDGMQFRRDIGRAAVSRLVAQGKIAGDRAF